MIDKVRLATPEEIERIKSISDLHEGTTVLAFGEDDKADFAVLRNLIEVDPLISATENAKRKALFMWAVENMLRFQGVQRYYFNISPADEVWKKNIETWGAVQTSTAPELRYRKDL